MARRPVVLLHGYSDEATSFDTWRAHLVGAGHDATTVHVGDFVSLSNEITIKDLAEGFDRALRICGGLDAGEPFDAIVHSTGSLVLREWLATYGARARRVKRLIGLAPANFGSPLAHKGASWLGALFKGDKRLGPDFMEAGTRILDGLELGSRYTWELAERDLVGDNPVYDATADTPFPFVIVGDRGYRGLRKLVNFDGGDGTVRWTGAALSTRKILIDLTRAPGDGAGERIRFAPWANLDVPFAFARDHDHGSILREPKPELVQMVLDALAVEDVAAYGAWAARHGWSLDDAAPRRWQQFVMRAVDERGDPVPDWFLEVGSGHGDAFEPFDDFDLDVHPYGTDPSFRCFHADLGALRPEQRTSLVLRLTARSGSELVAYHGVGSKRFTAPGAETSGEDGVWDACIDLTSLLADDGVRFFFPFTTTLVELRLNREPMPPAGVNRVLRFVDRDE
jgi:hypothetical protein